MQIITICVKIHTSVAPLVHRLVSKSCLIITHPVALPPNIVGRVASGKVVVIRQLQPSGILWKIHGTGIQIIILRPGFRDSFVNQLAAMGIQADHSFCYNAQSNGPAEWGVWSLKEIFKKTRTHLTEIQLHQQGGNMDSPNDKFFKRSVRSALPNST